jgi:thiamine-phosphate pyrophosphorylase
MQKPDWKLYVITDTKRFGGRPLEEVVRQAVQGGASVIQLRDKTSSDGELESCVVKLLKITRPKGIPLIINDRVQAAKRAGADGVHLGQEDGTIEHARTVLGPGSLIGRSTHSSEQAMRAQAEGFDYIGVGPVYETPTKPGRAAVGLELVRFAAANIRIPFVAIGGIDAENIDAVLKAGARSVAVVRAVMMAEDPAAAARNLLEKINGYER